MFALARQARGMPKARLRSVLTSPAIQMPMPTGFMQSRQLGNTVSDGALWAHLQGNDVEAIERIRNVLHISRCLRQDELLVSQLVAIGMDALACDRAQVIAPGLRVSEGPEARRKVRMRLCRVRCGTRERSGGGQCVGGGPTGRR